METQALDTVVRFLDPKGDKWVGTGFLVPPQRGETGLFVMTCAHVVAEALGDADLCHSPSAPKGQVQIIFRDQTSELFAAEVVADTWRAVPPQAQEPDGAIDMAVLRLVGLQDRPQGTRFPRFSNSPKGGNSIIANGPRNRGHTKLSRKTHWARGTLNEPNRSDELEFLMDGDINDNIIFGGFSGGPLTDPDTYEVLGMVRSVQQGQSRRAYALPVSLLATVWAPILARRAPTQRNIHPIFDLIARDDQATKLSKETRLRLEATHAGNTPPIPMTFTISGAFDEDHAHMNRRAFLEIAEHVERGNRSAQMSYASLTLPGGFDVEEQLALLAESILQACNAVSSSVADLATALERASPEGWLFHLRLDGDASSQDGEVLDKFLTLWAEIADETDCELNLHLSFTYDDQSNSQCGTATLHTGLTDRLADNCIRLQPMRPVSISDLETWRQTLISRGYISDHGVAEELAFQVEDLFLSETMPMRKLRRVISKAKIDPESL